MKTGTRGHDKASKLCKKQTKCHLSSGRDNLIIKLAGGLENVILSPQNTHVKPQITLSGFICFLLVRNPGRNIYICFKVKEDVGIVLEPAVCMCYLYLVSYTKCPIFRNSCAKSVFLFWIYCTACICSTRGFVLCVTTYTLSKFFSTESLVNVHTCPLGQKRILDSLMYYIHLEWR